MEDFIKLNIKKFSSLNIGETYTSPVVNIKPKGSQYTLDQYAMKFTVKLNSQSISDNKSYITITSYMKTFRDSWGWNNFSYIYMQRYTKVNDEIGYTLAGQTELKKLPTNNANVWVNCGSASVYVDHDENGECSLYIQQHLSTSGESSSYDYLPKDTYQTSEELILNPLHKVPEDITYTLTETNPKLVSASVGNNVFVKDISIKSFNVDTANITLFDEATISKYYIYNVGSLTTTIESTINPTLVDFKNTLMNTIDDNGTTKVPIRIGVLDSMNGLGYDTGDANTNVLYNYIPYNKIKLSDDEVVVSRLGQVSGRVSLSVKGTYYTGEVGNVDQGNNYKPTIKYKYWKQGDTEPSTYANTINSSDITINNGEFSVLSLDIGSSTETDPNYFDPDYAWRIKVQASDTFEEDESTEKSIAIGQAVWTEYKDRVDFKKITINGQEFSGPVVEDISNYFTFTDTTNFTLTNKKILKYGNVVYVSISMTAKKNVTGGSTNYDLFSVDSAYTGTSTKNFSAIVQNASYVPQTTKVLAFIRIANSVLRFRFSSTISTNFTLDVFGTYIID